MRNYTPDPRLYELVTILSPDVSEEDIPGQVDSIAGYVTTAGGSIDEILRDSPWGRRRLAYTIRHAGRDIRDGYYTVFHLTMDPGGVREIERDLKLNDQVLRFLITHYTPKPVQPGQQPEGGDPGASTGESPPVADATSNEAPDAAASMEGTAASEPEQSDPASDAPVAETTAESEAPTVEPATDVAVESPVDTVDEVHTDDTAADAVVEAPDESAPVVPEAASETAPEAEASSVDESTDISESPDTPVEADAAPAEPTAPAKDTEEA